jgi:hypothetical protein
MASKSKGKGSKKAKAKKTSKLKLTLHKETVKDMKTLVKRAGDNDSVNVCVA